MSSSSETADLSRNFVTHLVCASAVVFSMVVYAYQAESDKRYFIEQALPDILVQRGSVSGQLPRELPPISLDLKSEQNLEDTDLDSLAYVQMQKLILSITPKSIDSDVDRSEDGKSDNFNFLDSMKLYIVALVDGERTQGLVASLDENNAQLTGSRTRVIMKQTGLDIKKYIEAPSGFRLIAEITGAPPPDDVIFTGEVTYRMGIGNS